MTYIRNKALSSFALALIFTTNPLWALDCIPDDINLTTQQEVDDFQISHGPNCTHVIGELNIRGENIANLTALSQIVEVGGRLVVAETTTLTVLLGLDQVSKVGELSIFANVGLENLTGLGNLTEISNHFGLSDNSSLIDLSGLGSLQIINANDGGFFDIRNNPALTTLQGMPSAAIPGYGGIWLVGNPLLTDLEGMPIVGLVNRLEITSNDGLLNLKGLQVEGTAFTGRISIQNNSSLLTLEGLEWMERTTDLVLFRNHALNNLDGLENLHEADSIVIEENPSLISLEGLSGLVEVKDLPPLSGSNNSKIWIRYNQALPTLNGLENLVSVDGNIWLHSNELLFDCLALQPLLDGMDDYNPGPGPGGQGVPDVSGSISLSDNRPTCRFPELLDIISLDGFDHDY